MFRRRHERDARLHGRYSVVYCCWTLCGISHAFIIGFSAILPKEAEIRAEEGESSAP